MKEDGIVVDGQAGWKVEGGMAASVVRRVSITYDSSLAEP